MKNTISIYLQIDSSTLQIVKSCNLYKGSYKDKQINVYVPKSMLFEVEGDNILNTVSLGAMLVSEQGVRTTTIPYYPDYVQDEVINGVEYAVYSLEMPNTFTAYVGTQTIFANIVSVDNSDPANPLVLQISPSQTIDYVVNESANISQEEVIPADQVTVINGQIQDIQSTLALKQNIADNTLTTTNKTVPTAINEINTQAQSNASTIATQTTQITNLQNDVAELQAKLAGAEIPIGSMTGTTMPTNAQLTAYTVQQTGEQPQPNNVIIFTLEVEGGTDRVFKYIYVSTDDGWMYYEIPALEHASNGTYGSLMGTYGVDSTNNVLVNIMDGEIVDIYYKDSNGTYQNIQSAINLLAGTQNNILNGTQVVGKATQAIQDQLGNVINTTYAEADTVYTKTQSDEKYLPKTYTNIYYFATDGLVDDVPTTPASGIQFTQTANTVGDFLLCDVSRVTTGDYHFTKNSSDNSSIVLATDVNCTLQFRLETYANETLLASDLSDTMQFVANTPQTLDITSIYSGLGTTEIDVPSGSTISKKLYIISEDTMAKTVSLYCNSTYPSTYQLNAQSIVLTVNTINGLKPVYITEDEWTDNGDNTYTVVIPQSRHQQPASTRYFLELQKQVTANSYQYIAFTPIVSDDGDITITTNEAIDCVLLIGSNLATDEKGILTITNPTVTQEIDYNLYGAMKVIQTAQPVALSLLAPTDTSKFYAFFITNDGNSTETINWNGEDITPGAGLQFRWNGAEWIVGEQPTNTTEIYDTANEQLLSTTLTQLSNGIADNASDITVLQNSKADTTALAGYVPTTRTINGKALSNNIALSASDVGTYTDAEIDSALSNKQDTLTAGSKITIASNNTISTTAGLTLIGSATVSSVGSEQNVSSSDRGYLGGLMTKKTVLTLSSGISLLASGTGFIKISATALGLTGVELFAPCVFVPYGLSAGKRANALGIYGEAALCYAEYDGNTTELTLYTNTSITIETMATTFSVDIYRLN